MNFLNLPGKKIPPNQAKALILPVPCNGLSKASQGMDKAPRGYPARFADALRL